MSCVLRILPIIFLKGGGIFWIIHQYLWLRRPTAFILENVAGLSVVHEGQCIASVLRALWDLQVYNVYWDLLNTCDHGIPQSRARFFFVGILRTVDLGFEFPAAMPCPPLEVFLDPRECRPSFADLPPASAATARQNALRGLDMLVSSGHDPFNELWVLDIDSSAGWGAAMANCSPCLTRSRTQGFWLTNRGRRMRLQEAMRLQGLDSGFPVIVSEGQMRKQLGNSMSVNVLERLLSRLLPAAQLSSGQPVRDRYEGRWIYLSAAHVAR